MGNGVLPRAMQYDGLRCGVGGAVKWANMAIRSRRRAGEPQQTRSALRFTPRAVAATERGLFTDDSPRLRLRTCYGYADRRDEATPDMIFQASGLCAFVANLQLPAPSLLAMHRASMMARRLLSSPPPHGQRSMGQPPFASSRARLRHRDVPPIRV